MATSCKHRFFESKIAQKSPTERKTHDGIKSTDLSNMSPGGPAIDKPKSRFPIELLKTSSCAVIIAQLNISRNTQRKKNGSGKRKVFIFRLNIKDASNIANVPKKTLKQKSIINAHILFKRYENP